MITLQVNRPVRLPMEKSILVEAAQLTLAINASGKPDLGIVVGNDTLLRKLNQQYRGVDAATDVLSFPSGELDPDTAQVYLGDVVISLPRAEEQAAAEGHPLAEELQLLVVHGVLHLLGYDHEEEMEKEKMQASQDKTLQALGIEIQVRL